MTINIEFVSTTTNHFLEMKIFHKIHLISCVFCLYFEGKTPPVEAIEVPVLLAVLGTCVKYLKRKQLENLN